MQSPSHWGMHLVLTCHPLALWLRCLFAARSLPSNPWLTPVSPALHHRLAVWSPGNSFPPPLSLLSCLASQGVLSSLTPYPIQGHRLPSLLFFLPSNDTSKSWEGSLHPLGSPHPALCVPRTGAWQPLRRHMAALFLPLLRVDLHIRPAAPSTERPTATGSCVRERAGDRGILKAPPPQGEGRRQVCVLSSQICLGAHRSMHRAPHRAFGTQPIPATFVLFLSPIQIPESTQSLPSKY